jgi:predicted metal-dependent phosphoesterase TrpH
MIHAQGGLAVAAHPFLRATSRFADGSTARMGLGAAIRRVPIDGIEVFNSFPTLAPANLKARRYNAKYRGFPELGSSDAHVKEVIGRGYTRFAGHTAADFAVSLRSGETTAHWRPYAYAQLRAYFGYWRQRAARDGAGR